MEKNKIELLLETIGEYFSLGRFEQDDEEIYEHVQNLLMLGSREIKIENEFYTFAEIDTIPNWEDAIDVVLYVCELDIYINIPGSWRADEGYSLEDCVREVQPKLVSVIKYERVKTND